MRFVPHSTMTLAGAALLVGGLAVLYRIFTHSPVAGVITVLALAGVLFRAVFPRAP